MLIWFQIDGANIQHFFWFWQEIFTKILNKKAAQIKPHRLYINYKLFILQYCFLTSKKFRKLAKKIVIKKKFYNRNRIHEPGIINIYNPKL